MDIINNLITFTYCLYLIQHFFLKRKMIHAGYEQEEIIAEKNNIRVTRKHGYVLCLVVDVVLGFFFLGGGAMSLSSFQYKSPKNLLHCLSEYYFVIKKKTP